MSTAARDPQFVAVQTTVGTPEEARALAGRAMQEHLAACVQISEITSVYRWDGAVQDDPEQLLTVKTTAAAVPGLRELLSREHPYEEPELIVLPIIDGSEGYLQWIRSSVTGTD